MMIQSVYISICLFIFIVDKAFLLDDVIEEEFRWHKKKRAYLFCFMYPHQGRLNN